MIMFIIKEYCKYSNKINKNNKYIFHQKYKENIRKRILYRLLAPCYIFTLGTRRCMIQIGSGSQNCRDMKFNLIKNII